MSFFLYKLFYFVLYIKVNFDWLNVVDMYLVSFLYMFSYVRCKLVLLNVDSVDLMGN